MNIKKLKENTKKKTKRKMVNEGEEKGGGEIQREREKEI